MNVLRKKSNHLIQLDLSTVSLFKGQLSCKRNDFFFLLDDFRVCFHSLTDHTTPHVNFGEKLQIKHLEWHRRYWEGGGKRITKENFLLYLKQAPFFFF